MELLEATRLPLSAGRSQGVTGERAERFWKELRRPTGKRTCFRGRRLRSFPGLRPRADRFRDRYQIGNQRTIRHGTDISTCVSQRNDTGRIQAHTKPSNSGPGGRRFESSRPDHLSFPGALRQQRGPTRSQADLRTHYLNSRGRKPITLILPHIGAASWNRFMLPLRVPYPGPEGCHLPAQSRRTA
jgi:hypothetical protein